MKCRFAVALCTIAALAGSALAQQAYKPSAVERPVEKTSQSRRGLERRAPAPLVLPAGTALRIRLERSLSTSRNRVGDKFAGMVTEAVSVDGRTVVPVGAHVTGRLEHKSQPRRVKGHPSIRLHPDELLLPDGQAYRIKASVVDSSNPRHTRVSERGDISGPSISKGQKIETVALTGTGAVAGAVVAGPVGAVVGAAAGAGASAGHYMMRRPALVLPAGTVLILELDSPIHLGSTEWASSR